MKMIFVNSIFKIDRDSYPIGLVSLGSILHEEGYDVEIVDFSILTRENKFSKTSFENGDINEFVKYICGRKPSVISFYTMANSMHISISVANKIKALGYEMPIIFAGPQASVCAEELLNAFDFIDIVAIGEGELIIKELLNALKTKSDLSTIPGLAYRSENPISLWKSFENVLLHKPIP